MIQLLILVGLTVGFVGQINDRFDRVQTPMEPAHTGIVRVGKKLNYSCEICRSVEKNFDFLISVHAGTLQPGRKISIVEGSHCFLND